MPVDVTIAHHGFVLSALNVLYVSACASLTSFYVYTLMQIGSTFGLPVHRQCFARSLQIAGANKED